MSMWDVPKDGPGLRLLLAKLAGQARDMSYKVRWERERAYANMLGECASVMEQTVKRLERLEHEHEVELRALGVDRHNLQVNTDLCREERNEMRSKVTEWVRAEKDLRAQLIAQDAELARYRASSGPVLPAASGRRYLEE